MKFVWTAKCQDAFEAIKSVLWSEPILMVPDFDKQFKLYVDASDIGLGAVLLQEDVNGQDYPICYFSRKFSCHQRYYCTSEKEALSLILSLQHFEVYLNSTAAPVLVFTDHNPLVHLQRTRNHNWKLLHWSLLLQEFQLEIRHVKDKNNVVADTLSRAMRLLNLLAQHHECW